VRTFSTNSRPALRAAACGGPASRRLRHDRHRKPASPSIQPAPPQHLGIPARQPCRANVTDLRRCVLVKKRCCAGTPYHSHLSQRTTAGPIPDQFRGLPERFLVASPPWTGPRGPVRECGAEFGPYVPRHSSSQRVVATSTTTQIAPSPKPPTTSVVQ
jgi:hypothetical protein